MKTTRRCKICREKFEPKYSTLQPVCSTPACMIAFAQLSKKKEDKKWIADTKEKHKTHGYFENLLQTDVNKIVRLIDKGHDCISHEGKGIKVNGGHYHSVGSNNSIRFHLLNNFLQCESCNSYKGSNRTGYDAGLKKLFGHDVWLYINEGIIRDNPHIKMSIAEIKEKLVLAKQIIRELEQADMVYSVDERLTLRKYYNERLGIFT